MQTAQNKGPAILFLIPAAVAVAALVVAVAVIVIAARMMMAQSWPVKLIVANCVQLRPAELTHSDSSYHKAANKLKEPAVSNNKKIEQKKTKKIHHRCVAFFFSDSFLFCCSCAYFELHVIFSSSTFSSTSFVFCCSFVFFFFLALYSFFAVCGAFVHNGEKRVEN